MQKFLLSMTNGVASRWEWFRTAAQTPHARMWLGVYSFFESVILPFPTDIFLALMVYADRARAWALTLWTVLSSIFGAIVAYGIAYFFYATLGETLVNYMGIAGQVQQISETLNQYAFLAVFLGAFTPIPYTPVIFAAGFLGTNFLVFVVASLLGRALRYTLVTLVVLFFGTAVLPRLGALATKVTVALGVCTLAALVVFIVFH